MIIVFPVRPSIIADPSNLQYSPLIRRLIDPLRGWEKNLYSRTYTAGRISTQSSSLRDDYDRTESTIMQITTLDCVMQCHVLLLDDIDCAVSILRCPTSLLTLLWLSVLMTFSASWLSSWLGLSRARVSENNQ